jgi:hypothetical protein
MTQLFCSYNTIYPWLCFGCGFLSWQNMATLPLHCSLLTSCDVSGMVSNIISRWSLHALISCAAREHTWWVGSSWFSIDTNPNYVCLIPPTLTRTFSVNTNIQKQTLPFGSYLLPSSGETSLYQWRCYYSSNIIDKNLCLSSLTNWPHRVNVLYLKTESRPTYFDYSYTYKRPQGILSEDCDILFTNLCSRPLLGISWQSEC